ncbi:MAG: hypothetical protein KC457_08870 [Myxococcales bacterium]|nr:hypothetical protein [Myxococcales bacterium]
MACAPGLEPLLLEELGELGVEEATIVAGGGGVSCFGSIADVYRLNLCCGLGLRVLVRVAEFIARDFRKLERVTAALEWEHWLEADRGYRVRVHSKRSRLYHSKAIAERIERSIGKRTKGKVQPREDVGARGPGGGELGEGASEPTLLQVRLVRDRCTISLDTTGTLLHKRGWRQQTGKAPLREDLARALLRLAGWRPGMALVDPVCGAGTLAIEAATMAAGLPPGHARKFAFMDMRDYDNVLFQTVRSEAVAAGARAVAGLAPAPILGRDRDAGAVAASQANAARAGVEARVTFVEASVGDLELPAALREHEAAHERATQLIRAGVGLGFERELVRRFVARLYGMIVILGKPKSRGSVTLGGPLPHDDPRIDPAYFSDPEDLETMVRGIERARQITGAPALRAWGAREIFPGRWATSAKVLAGVVRANAMTTYHFAGTCRMGEGDHGVVDEQLRLRGVAGLRVADASVMPVVPVSALNGPSMLIGYRAASLILAGS